MQAVIIFIAIAVMQTLLLLFLRGMALTIIDVSFGFTLLILIYRKLSELTERGRPADSRRQQRLLREAEEAKADDIDESDLPSKKDIMELAKEDE